LGLERSGMLSEGFGVDAIVVKENPIENFRPGAGESPIRC